MIDFSIIIPAYNLEQCIVKTLESVCKNNLENTEIIVVDDGSTDGTKQLIEDFLYLQQVPHYQVISQINKGVSAARNTGIAKATGRYLIFCDGDDLCSENLIEILNEYKYENFDMLVWRYCILQGDDKKVSQEAYKSKVLCGKNGLKSFLLEGNRIRLGSFAVKKDMLNNKAIDFTEGCAIAEDIEFMYKCLAVAGTIRTLDDVLFTYVKRAGSAMNAFDWRRFQSPPAVRRVYDYVKNNTSVLEDLEIEDYLYNGFYLLHSIFSFDACIQYLRGWKEASQFMGKYLSDYPEIEMEIKRITKEMKIKPTVFSKKRLALFGISRKLYVYYYVIISGLKKGL